MSAYHLLSSSAILSSKTCELNEQRRQRPLVVHWLQGLQACQPVAAAIAAPLHWSRGRHQRVRSDEYYEAKAELARYATDQDSPLQVLSDRIPTL